MGAGTGLRGKDCCLTAGLGGPGRNYTPAYDTVTSILAAARGTGASSSLVMGMHPRHERLVLDLLAGQRRRGLAASFFEIGFASGKLLKRVADAGFPLAGIEVSTTMRDMAVRLLGSEHRERLYLGNFLEPRKIDRRRAL